MKKILLFIFMSFQTLALEYGECIPKPSSKKYIDADFHTSFPKTINFSCTYECLVSSLQKISAVSTIVVRNVDEEAVNLVCQGVIVKKAKWGYEFDKTVPFFIYDTDLIEINNLAKLDGVPVDTKSSESLNQKMIQTLETVANAYKIAGANSQPFAEASLILKKMSGDFTIIDSYIEELREQNFRVGREFSAKNLIFSVLLTSARHRIIL